MLRIRLSILMFLQVFIFGSIMPVMSLYLTTIRGFSGTQAGIILSMGAFSYLLSPFISAFIVDKIISVERYLSISHFLCFVTMVFYYFQTNFVIILITYLLYMLLLGPTVAMVNAIVFHHEPDAKKNFAKIRIWGTIGWIAAAWIFSYVLLGGATNEAASEKLSLVLLMAASISLLISLYAFTLPRSRVKKTDRVSIIPVEAFKVLLKPDVLLIVSVCFIVFFTDQFYFFGMGPYLDQLGYGKSKIMPMLSLAQMAEIIAMISLGFLLMKSKFKPIIFFGILFNVWRYSALILGTLKPLTISGILCQGLAYAFFYVPVYVYIDNRSDRISRSGVQQLLVMLTFGLGGFMGNFTAGKSRDFFTNIATQSVNYDYYWMIPLTFISLILIVFFLFFKEHKSTSPEQIIK